MKISEKKEKYGYEYKKRAVRKVELGSRFLYFYYYNNFGNCKLRTLDSLGSCLRKKEKETIQAIKDVVSGKAFFVNLIYKKDIEILDKYFDRVYLNEVDMGYTRKEGVQYHALYISPNCKGRWRERLKKQANSKSKE